MAKIVILFQKTGGLFAKKRGWIEKRIVGGVIKKKPTVNSRFLSMYTLRDSNPGPID